MKTTVKHLSDTRVLVTISIGAPELEAAQQVALKHLAKTTKVQGFRKGRAPLDVVAKHVDQSALSQDTLNNALSKAVAEAYLNNEIQALERPAVEIKKFVPGDLLEFTAEGDVLPKVTLGNYKKLQAVKEPVTVTKADVDEVVTRIQKGYSEKKETSAAAVSGDEVVIDYVGTKDGEAFEGGTAQEYSLTLGSNSFIPGFEDALIGTKAGETKDIPLTFPQKYPAKELAGKKVIFSVTIKKVNQIVVPELTDEFAAKVGPFTDVAELKKDIKAEITAQKEREATDKLKDSLVKQLVEKSKVAVPSVLRKDQIRSIEQDMTQNLMYRGMTLEQYFETNGFKDRNEWLEKEAGPAAEDRVKAGLVLAELSKVENIQASSDELAERINSFRTQYANNPDMAKRFDEPEVQREVANRLITEKTVTALVELNR